MSKLWTLITDYKKNRKKHKIIKVKNNQNIFDKKEGLWLRRQRTI